MSQHPELSKEEYQSVMDSYNRCWVQGGFFGDFYTLFMDSHPEIKELFKHTDFRKQHTLLRVGLAYLIIFADNPDSVRLMIRELGDLHSRAKLNIRPEMYPHWINSLVEAVRKHDPLLNGALENAWRKVLHPGVDYMASLY